jgi:DNA replication and repair protein RecF
LLASLKAEQLRSLRSAELEFGHGLNLVCGPNGAGKTSLLEAVFLLGRGRSFRTRSNDRLIAHGDAWARVVGRAVARSGEQVIGVEISRTEGTRARIAGRTPDSLAELAVAFPVQVMDPDIHKLVEEGSARRRRWLDWGVFHVEHGFGQDWARYQRALKQRNAALRAGEGDATDVWDIELNRAGRSLNDARARVVGELAPRWTMLCQRLAGLELTMQFYPGWEAERPLLEVLRENASRDRERRMTTAGPHRADLRLRYQGRLAREVLSRGQQKLVAVALTLAQLQWLKAEHDLLPTLLLDDPAAELDQSRLAAFIAEVQALETQLIVTSLNRDATPLGQPEKLFHVEQGRVETL